MPELAPADGPLHKRLYEIVFHADDPVAKTFDVALMVAIVASVVVVMLESVGPIEARYAGPLRTAEWCFTALFTAEYLLRLAIVKVKRDYALSFFGVVDFLSVIPTYLSLFIPGAQALLVVRILRVLRIFRVLKLASYVDEAEMLGRALAASKRKILVFVFVVMTLVTVMGSMMYLIEGGENGFASIPDSIYWAVVTLSTVGYGDISPVTAVGKALAVVIILMGYGIIAVPTGIVTVELGREIASGARRRQYLACPCCGLDEHDADARFCKRCGDSILRPEAKAEEMGIEPPPALPPEAYAASGDGPAPDAAPEARPPRHAV